MAIGDPDYHAHQASEEVPFGLIICIPIFLSINVLLAVIGARWMNRLSHDSSEDVLTAHYLGGRSFGPWLTLGTMFASLFSGFTIIGIPNDAVSVMIIILWFLLYYRSLTKALTDFLL
jgi:Na+/proline symporter